jgi:hypothetical protein
MYPGVAFYKIPIKSPAGLLFVLTVGVLIVFLYPLPDAGWFLALNLPVGFAVGWLLRRTGREWWPSPGGSPSVNVRREEKWNWHWPWKKWL